MKESNSDAARLEKLLKNYKDEKFHKGLNYISCDGVIIKNSVVRENGINVVKYDVLVDGHRVGLSESMRERVRDVYSRVFYCEPDDTPLRSRLIAWGGYLAVCALLAAAVYGATKLDSNADDQNIKINKKGVPRMPQNTLVLKSFEQGK